MSFFTHPVFSPEALSSGWIVKLPSKAEAHLFGGVIRDAFLGLPARDHDFLVSGVTQKDLESAGLVRGEHPFIERYTYPESPLDEVMRSTHPGNPTESMTAMMWTRDLTIHALGFDVLRRTWFDPTGFGRKDLEDRFFRMTSPEVCEDPIVTLRWARLHALHAPLGFRMDEETWSLATEQSRKLGFSVCDPSRLHRQLELIKQSGVAPQVWGSLAQAGLMDHFKEAQMICKEFEKQQPSNPPNAPSLSHLSP